jgi:hypothetical protein
MKEITRKEKKLLYILPGTSQGKGAKCEAAIKSHRIERKSLLPRDASGFHVICKSDIVTPNVELPLLHYIKEQEETMKIHGLLSRVMFQHGFKVRKMCMGFTKRLLSWAFFLCLHVVVVSLA